MERDEIFGMPQRRPAAGGEACGGQADAGALQDVLAPGSPVQQVVADLGGAALHAAEQEATTEGRPTEPAGAAGDQADQQLRAELTHIDVRGGRTQALAPLQ